MGSNAIQWAVFCLIVHVCGLALAEVRAFDPALPAGSRCRVAITELRPTQFCVGYWEIEQRTKSIVHKKPKKLAAYLEEHLAEIVIGPDDRPYLTDGHHIAVVLLKSHLSETVEAVVKANWRNLDRADFWRKMHAHGWLYLYDNQGRGPLDPEKLPKKVTEMADDPYRSLAWAVRKRAGYEKIPASYSEFQWANFFRKRVSIGSGEGDFERAVETALQWSRSPEAQDLPGYQGRSNP
ncbi:MAG: ParB-like protein [Thermoguttaceae bacterium]